MLNLRRHVVLIGVVVLAFLAACGSEEPGPNGFVDTGPSITSISAADIHIVERASPRLSRVRPIPHLVQLAPGETVALSAVAFDQNGRELPTATFVWQMADTRAGTITTRGVFRAGLIRGFFDQAISVTARVSSEEGTVSLQSTSSVAIGDLGGELVPASLLVIPGQVEAIPDEVQSLIVLAVDANRVTVPQQQFRWEMVEPLAGSITQNGEFTASRNPGEYPEAIKVVLTSTTSSAEPIQTLVDVTVLEPGQALTRISASVLPQFISVTPDETFRFTAVVLDRQGNRLPAENLRWEILDSVAGVISEDGLYQAGDAAGTYPDVVKVTLTTPNLDQELTAMGTVSILDADNIGTGPPSAARFTIFPDRLVLGPGETGRISIIGLDSNGDTLSEGAAQWSLDPSHAAEMDQNTQFVNITAGEQSGVYENAVKVTIVFDDEEGRRSEELSSTLVVRGALDSVEITPQVATLEPGSRVLFRAVAYDENSISLPDVSLRWMVLDPDAGSIDSDGLFTAGEAPGEYPGAVEVTAIQRQSRRP